MKHIVNTELYKKPIEDLKTLIYEFNFEDAYESFGNIWATKEEDSGNYSVILISSSNVEIINKLTICNLKK